MGANPSADARDGFAGLIEGWDSGFAPLPGGARAGPAGLVRLRRRHAAGRLPGPPQADDGHVLHAALAGRGQEPGRRGDRLPGPAREASPTRRRRGSSRWRSARTPSSTATWSWSARAREAGWPPRCSPRPALTSWWSRRAATSARRTSTAPSSTATCGSTSAAAVCPRPTRAWGCSPASASAAARRSTTPGASARRTTFARTGGTASGSTTGWGRTSTTASTRSGSASTSTPRTACPRCATSASARASPSSAGIPR